MSTHSTESKQDLKILQTISVLYIEDEVEVLDQLSLFLKRKIGTLYTALNGEEGLELYKKHSPDVIITDIRMPTMDGLELAKIIREIDQDIPIIVTTAFNEQQYFLQSIDIGIDKYVLKPIDPYLLLDTIVKSVTVLAQKRQIALNNRYNRFVLDANPSFTLTTNQNEIQYINKTFLNFLGYSSLEEFREDKKDLTDFFAQVEGIPSYEQNKKHWLQYIINNPGKDILIYFNHPQGPKSNHKIFLVTCSRFPELDKYIFSFTDITNIEKAKQEFQRQANTDILTGMFNRKKLIEVLQTEMHRTVRYKTPLSVIMFDIDNLKSINDTYGHNTGDSVLKETTKIIFENIRDTDTLARWGGDEFLILAPETDISDTKQMAQKLSSVIREVRLGKVGEVTSSFGVAQFKQDDDMSSFINRVDTALYNAKKHGRGHVK